MADPDPVLSARHALAGLASRATDPEAALREAVAIIARAVGAEGGFAALFNPDSEQLEFEGGFGLSSAGGPPLSLGQGVPGWVAWHAKPLLVPDTRQDSRYRAVRPDVLCQMAAPMLAEDGQMLGVVTLDGSAPGCFGPAELDLLTRLTDEAARVLRRLWHLARLEVKALQLETLLTTGQSLVSKFQAQELFDTLARDTRSLTQTQACGLYLYEPATRTVRLASFVSPGPAPASAPLPLDSCLFASAIHTRHALAFSDLRSAEFRDVADLPPDPALRSVLATPLAYEGEVLGVLAVFMDRIHRFDNDQKRLCLALAGLGAVALQNSRLYSRVFQSEDALRKNERLTTLGLLAAEIAHEIRNPLTVLKLLLGGLGLDFPEGDPRRTDVRVIGEKLDQLEDIVSRVLNFAKAPSSLHTRFPIADVVEDTLVLVRLKLAQSKIQLRFEPESGPLTVEGHKGQLQQVLLNLLLNSVQVMPDGGTIEVRLRREAREGAAVAALEVADTGPGIPEALRGRIFDSFLSGRADGTGLGLAIAKRILLGHHGDLELASSSPAGTTWRLFVPLVREHRA